jgi:hypothetical protein
MDTDAKDYKRRWGYSNIMAWPNATFEGRSFGALAGDLSALMVAVNERESSMGSQAGTGTLASSGTTVTGTSTAFTSQLSVGDTIIVSGQKRIVDTITDLDTLDTTVAFSPVLSAEPFRFIHLTQFTIADGTRKANPTEADLTGFVFGDINRGTTSGTGTVSSSGTTVTGTGTLFTDELSVGDTITADGQDRVVNAITNKESLTTSVAFSPVLSSDSYTIPDAKKFRDGIIQVQNAAKALVDRTEDTGTGTLVSSGTAVTGTGTSFTTELAVGDTILTGTGLLQKQEVATITDATNLTTVSAFSPVLAGNTFAYITLDDEQPIYTATNTDRIAITHAKLIDDIGIEDLTGSENFTTNFQWWDENVWERLRQYLDSLTLVYVGDDERGGGNQTGGATDSVQSTAQLAWDNAISNEATGTVPGSPTISWQVSQGAAGNYTANYREATEASFDISMFGFLGTVSNSEITVGTATTAGNDSHTWAGATVTVDGNETEINPDASVSLTAPFTIDGSKTTPATVPFAPDVLDIDTRLSIIEDGVLQTWIDMSSQLTDQA